MRGTSTGFGSFGRTLLFGTMAALALLAAWPLLRGSAWLCPFLVGTAIVYAAGLAPAWRTRLRIGVLAAGLGLLALLLSGGLAESALAAALVLAVCRSGLAFRTRPARALATELVLVGAGLGLARFVSGGHPLSWALALWSFFVVQSVYFLMGGLQLRVPDEAGDPFERARARLESLLAEWDS